MIKVILKPEKGIQIDETKKYLFDPSVVQPYVDASAENAIKAEENANKAEQTFADVSAFVDTSKSEITGIIEQGKNEIATAIDDGRMEISDSILEATEEVKKAGQEAAQEAVQGAADEATRIATEQLNTYVVDVVSPQIQEFVNNAEADASNAAESAGLAAEEANKSSVSASDSQHYSEDARIWAEGEQAEVKPLGGELSSMGWALQASNSATSASQSATQAKTSETNAKGYTELAKQYGNDKINQTHITNCITEIPQDIKLEFKDGVLTLKAGSKVYVPNGFEADGSNRFDVVTVANDVVKTDFGNDSGTRCLYLDINGTYLYGAENSASGTSTSSVDGMYYRTGENYVYPSNNASGTKHSFPVCKITLSSGSVTSIDQVFNGFGYIGSTVFALPGVKGLIPNGRNADGSLKNVEYTTSSVLTRTLTSQNIPVAWFCFNPKNSPVFGLANSQTFDYDITYNHNLLNGVRWDYTPIGRATVTNGVISDFMIRTAFQAVDRNDSAWVAKQALPSDKYINLTLGSSGSIYTAPANGWVCFGRRVTSSSYTTAVLARTAFQTRSVVSNQSGARLATFLPVSKGDVFLAEYEGAGEVIIFGFYYAEGEN